MDVTAIGELLIDFAAIRTDGEGYPILAANPGGAPGNFLAALSKYGASTAILAKVGEDTFGHLLVDTLEKAGVHTGGIRLDRDVFTTLAFVTFGPDGERSFTFSRKPGADAMLRFEELDLSLIDEANVFHFGTLSLTNEPAATATRRAVAYAKERGKLLTFDPNLRLPLWTSPETARAAMVWGLNQADIVKLSLEEVEFLWGLGAEEGARKLLEEHGVDLVFVTLGAEGCYFRNRNGAGYARYTGPLKVADTTGAGDIFGGAALSRILENGKAPGELSLEELRAIAAFACTAASLSTQYLGGISSIQTGETVRNAMKKEDRI